MYCMYMHIVMYMMLLIINCHASVYTQTRDLLEMMFNGFTRLCQEFLQEHCETNHYIVPVRINGNLIESLLIVDFKYNANGNLFAVNYMNLPWHAYLQLIKFQERTRIQEMSTETPTYMFMGKLIYNFGRFKFVSQV